eukprot:3043697-Amphidinium_carterae.1
MQDLLSLTEFPNNIRDHDRRLCWACCFRMHCSSSCSRRTLLQVSTDGKHAVSLVDWWNAFDTISTADVGELALSAADK